MKIGLIGLPNSGKTTVFNALTRLEAPVTAYAGAKAKPNVATVEVADERIDHLSLMYRPQKTVYATVEFIDFVGVTQGAAKGGLFSGSGTGILRTADALALVVRNFADQSMGPPTPMKDMAKVLNELLISDLLVAENRLERIAQTHRRGQKTDLLVAEEKVLRRIVDQVGQGEMVAALGLGSEEEKTVRGFQFLTAKPLMVILNSEESGFGTNPALLRQIAGKFPALEFAGRFEMELSRLDDPEQERLFMADMGIGESARSRLTRLAYGVLGYISFFTVGPDEVRAWNVRGGSTALEAAHAIHSELSRGFIRAECFTYDDLVALGSEKALREKGRVRLEGKNHIVPDGEIISIRFHV